MSRARLKRHCSRWVTVLAVLLAANNASSQQPSPQEILQSIVSAAAAGDTVSLAPLVEASPDLAYLAAYRLADGAVAKRQSGEEGSAEALSAARSIAEIYGSRTGNRALEEIVDLFSSYDADDVAEYAVGDSLHQAGIQLYMRGEYAEALDVFFKALECHESIGQIMGQGKDHAKIGEIYQILGDTPLARQHVEQAIELDRKIGFRGPLSVSLHALASIELREGNVAGVVAAAREIEQIGHTLGDDRLTGAALNLLASAYYLGGRYRDAIVMHQESLEISRRRGDLHGQAVDLCNIGFIYLSDLAEYDDGASALEEAAQISAEEGYASLEGIALSALAEVELERGHPEKALDEASRAILLLEPGENAEHLPEALFTRASLLRQMGRTADAEKDAKRALEMAREGASPYTLCEALVCLSLVETEMGRRDEGLGHAQEAIDLLEATRGQIGAEELRASSLYLKTHIYEAAIRALWDMETAEPGTGHAEEALRLAEQRKSRTMLDFLAAREQEPASAPDSTHDLLVERISSLQLEVLTDLANDERRNQACRRILTLRARLDSLEMARSEDVLAARNGTLLDVPSLIGSLRGSRDLLLEFFWGKEEVYGWALTPGGIRFFRPGESQNLEGLVAVFASLLRDPDRQTLDSRVPFELSECFLGPVSDAARDAERLIIVPDGPLLTIPFEALPCGKTVGEADRSGPDGGSKSFVAERFEVHYAPSASLWRHLTALGADRTREGPELVALGDPRVQEEVGGRHWPPLAYARIEIRELGRMFSPRRVHILSGKQASEDRVKSEEVSSSSALHFATHAYASTVDPSASGLLLAPAAGADGFLTSLEILDLRLRAGLVTLSGCETGLGRIVGGEGVLGLSRSFFYAGSATVVASLWEVDDEHTARLMARFYRHMADGAPKGEALALAKRDAISGQDGLSPHPYFWAPFVLMGDADGSVPLTCRHLYERAVFWVILGLGAALVLAAGSALRKRGRSAPYRNATPRK